MPLQHIDMFHCLKCGELIWAEHGSEPPNCCESLMVRAVSGIIRRYDTKRDKALPKSLQNAPYEEGVNLSEIP